MRETWVQSLGWEDPLEEGGHGNPLQYSYLENPHGQRSLAGYSLWGRKELNMTERRSAPVRAPQQAPVPVAVLLGRDGQLPDVVAVTSMGDSVEG